MHTIVCRAITRHTKRDLNVSFERRMMRDDMNNEQPNGAGLLALGILSVFLGPITGLPGVIMHKKFRPFTPSASVGYFLCWLGIVLGILAVLHFPLRRARQIEAKHQSVPESPDVQATPLSPALHLGAERILVIGVRNEVADTVPDPVEPDSYPSFAQIAGYTLDTLFMDGLYSDLERLSRINQLIDTVPPDHRGAKLSRMKPIDTMVIVPSKDLRVLAQKHRHELPRALRALLWGIGGKHGGATRLLSYLLFEQAYTRELIELGYHDAMQVREQLEDFIAGKEIPRLFAPHWVEEDLDILHP